MKYEFKTKPFEHQDVVLRKSWNAPYYGLFMEMGTGKTKVAIDNIGILYSQKKINAALILAPKGVFGNWTDKEFPAHLADNVLEETMILQWQPNHTKAYSNQFHELMNRKEGLTILVMNIEALSSAKGTDHAGYFLLRYPDCMMVVDESTTIKNRTAQRTKNVVKLGHKAKYRRILTGSPITKSPMDLFSQCNFLSDAALGFKSYYSFQGRYAVVVNKTMGPKVFKDIVGYRRLDELSDKLEGFSSRITKEECLDLPEKVYQPRYIALSEKQKPVYEQMRRLALAKLENGDLATTASVLTQIMRMQQIVCGILTTDDGEIQEIDRVRLTNLMEVLEETSGKVVIWATFTHNILQIRDAIAKQYGEDSVACYYGATETEERTNIVRTFQDPDSPLRFFIGQPKTGGYGITLTAASTMVYFSNSYDLEIRLQSEDRIHRIGQPNHCTYIDFVTPGTVDEKILKALRAKIDIAGEVLGEQGKEWLL
jgi:SNF2 family DNA or RNA helicase